MKIEHKELNEQRSLGDYCEFMSQFKPGLGQIAGPNQLKKNTSSIDLKSYYTV